MVSSRVLFVFCVICVAVVFSGEHKSALDAVDIDAVFKNERLLKNYVDCLLEKKPCSKEGAELKVRVPQVLETNCEDCSTNEKDRSVKTIKLMKETRPELWVDVKAKYDPTGKLTDAFDKRYISA